MRFFNITGPCNPTDHYMLPTTARWESFAIDRLLVQKSYFILHAPRQTGKTTAMLELARQLTAAGNYISVLVILIDEIDAPQDQVLISVLRQLRATINAVNSHPLVNEPVRRRLRRPPLGV